MNSRPPFSFCTHFIDRQPVRPPPPQFLRQAREAVNNHQNVAREHPFDPIRWEDMQRLLAIPASQSQNPASQLRAYLSDEIVNNFIRLLCKYCNERQQLRAARRPVRDLTDHNLRFLTWGSFWDGPYQNLLGGRMTADRFDDSVQRNMRRLHIQNSGDFYLLDTIFFPQMVNAHWTLGLIRPRTKKFGHLNSLSSGGFAAQSQTRNDHFCRYARRWLAALLADGYRAAEWTEEVFCESQEQGNLTDCGVYVCANAAAVAQRCRPHMLAMDMGPDMRKAIAILTVMDGFVPGMFEP